MREGTGAGKAVRDGRGVGIKKRKHTGDGRLFKK